MGGEKRQQGGEKQQKDRGGEKQQKDRDEEKQRQERRRRGDADEYRGEAYTGPHPESGSDSSAINSREGDETLPVPPMGPMAWAQEVNTAVFSDDARQQRDPEAEFLANAARRAHDEELAALASLALIRSGMANRDREQPERRPNQPPSQAELNERLRRILEDDDVPSGKRNRR